MGYSAPNLVQLDDVFDPMKKKLLLEIVILKICKFPYENLIFFLASYSKVFFRFSL